MHMEGRVEMTANTVTKSTMSFSILKKIIFRKSYLVGLSEVR